MPHFRFGRALGAALLCLGAVSSAQAATFTVTTTSDAVTNGTCDPAGSLDGCTLREAVNAANARAGADLVNFAPNVRGTIGLTRVGDNSSVYGPSALLVSEALVIDGPGPSALIVRAQSGGDYRIIRAAPQVALTVRGLSFANGVAVTGTVGPPPEEPPTGEPPPFTFPAFGDGGAIFASGGREIGNDPDTGVPVAIVTVPGGPLTVSNCAFQGNTALGFVGFDFAIFGNGGAIAGDGSVTVSGSTFESNSSDDDGGAVYGASTLSIATSTFENNFAQFGDGGAVACQADEGQPLSVRDSGFFENTSGSNGGALFSDAGASVLRANFAFNASENNGGAISSDGALSLSSSTLLENGAGDDGGALFLRGSATVSNCTLSDNATDSGSGGAISSRETRNETEDPPIVFLPTLNVSNSTLNNNFAGGFNEFFGEIANGGAIRADGALALTNCSLSGNIVDGGGGAVASQASATILNTTFANNLSDSDGGAIEALGDLNLRASTFTNNRCTDDGGAVSHEEDALTIFGCTFRNNSSLSDSDAEGGAVRSSGRVARVSNSSFTRNFAGENGGGLAFQTTEGGFAENCTFEANSTIEGGGVYVNVFPPSSEDPEAPPPPAFPVRLRNCTISGNNARESGGGISVDNGNVFLENCTITRNATRRSEGGGVAARPDADVRVSLRNTIVSGNSTSDLDYIRVITNPFEQPQPTVNTIFSLGNNLVGTGEAIGSFSRAQQDIISTNPGLAPLANNGGPTRTHALLASSPALDKASRAIPPTDQRGAPRPFDQPNIPPAPNGSNGDIGAYEAQAGLR